MCNHVKIMKNTCPSTADTRLELHVTEAGTAPHQVITIKMVHSVDTNAFTSILHATSSELRSPAWPWNTDPGFSFKSV